MHVHVYVYVHVFVRVHIRVLMHVHVYVHMYMYMYGLFFILACTLYIFLHITYSTFTVVLVTCRKAKSEVLKLEEQKAEQTEQDGVSPLLESSSSSSSSSSIELCEDLDIGTLGSKMKDTESEGDEEEEGNNTSSAKQRTVGNASLMERGSSGLDTQTHGGPGRSSRTLALVQQDSQGEVEEKDILELAEMEPGNSDEELPDKRSSRLRLPAAKLQREPPRLAPQHPGAHAQHEQHPHHHRPSLLQPFFDRKDVVVPTFVKVHKHHHHHHPSQADVGSVMLEHGVRFDGTRVDLNGAQPRSRAEVVMGGVKTWAKDFRVLVR